MEQAAQVYAAVMFLVIGLSHLFQPLAWVEYFRHLAERGTSGAFLEGFFLLIFGGTIVALHPVWHGLPLLLTLIGCAQIGKGAVRFIAPELALRMLRRVNADRAWEFRAAGIVSLAIAGFAAYLRFRG